MKVIGILVGAIVVFGSSLSPALARGRLGFAQEFCCSPQEIIGAGVSGGPRTAAPTDDFRCFRAEPVACLSSFKVMRSERTPANQSEGERPPPSDAGFKYTFENPRFYIPWIQLDLSLEGVGIVRFRRGESDDVLDRKVKLQPSTVSRIAELIARTGFLTSDEDYQSKRDFAHLGWMTISVNQGGKQRTVRFNYTERQDIGELAEIFRAITNQAITLFDIDLSIQHQPLDLPRMLDSLENELHLERFAEPDQLIPTLRDIAQDDTLPLIARNHATRMITSIQKGKYKSPVKPK